MPDLTNNESGRKPYIDPGRGSLNGGYINAMRRTTQKSENDGGPRARMLWSRRPIEQHDERGAALAYGLIEVGTPAGVSWGIAFDAAGGMYHTVTSGDIYYNFVALNQTTRGWEEISVAPNGNVYVVDSFAGIYVRTGGVGDFTLLEAGSFSCVSCAANGDIYAIKSSQIWKWDGLVFVSLAQTLRSYTGLTCAPNGDIYAAVYGPTGTGAIYIRAGGAGDFVLVDGDYPYARSLASAPNGDIFEARYQVPYYSIGIRAGGAGQFVFHFDVARPTQCMAVSPGGVLYLSSSLGADNKIYMLNTTTTIPPAKDTITQTHAEPQTVTRPLYKNLKPYANRTFEEMQQFAQPMEVTGRERVPETQGLPILIDHLPQVSLYVRSGAPIVIDIPTTDRDPISRVEVFRHLNAGGDDGTASVAPNGISVIYKPGAAGAALLTVYTRSGQQCTVNLMAK